MTKAEILDLINAYPVFHLATVEKGEPRVRGMLLYKVGREGIIFHTGAMKDVHRQLLQSPAVELCFNDPERHIQVRVRGLAESIDDPELKREIVSAPGREFLRPWIEKEGYGLLSVFRVRDCKATAWTMQTNFAPKAFVALDASEQD